MDQRERTIREIADHLARAMLAAVDYVDSRQPAPAEIAPAEPAAGRSGWNLLTVEDVAERLGVSPKTIYQWRTRRPAFGPQPFKIGKYLRWKRSEVEAWLDERERDDS